MLKLKNHEAVLEALAEQLKEFERELNPYQTDVYLYIEDGEGTIDTFTNVGGNSWLDDDHFTIYTDKQHNASIYERISSDGWKWAVDEIAEYAEKPELEKEIIEALTADMDQDDKKEIKSVNDLEWWEVKQFLEENYDSEVSGFYSDVFVPDFCTDGIGDQAYNALDDFENNHCFVVLNDGEFYAEYPDYNEAVKAAEELGDDADVEIWDDCNIDKAKDFGG